MANIFSRKHGRFCLLPLKSTHSKQFVVYDTLLEQAIGFPYTSEKNGLDMVEKLNRIAPTMA